MNRDVTDPQSRREFFRSAGRHLLLGAMGIGGFVVTRREGAKPVRQVCHNKSVCCNCGAFEQCRLPAALSAKQSDGEAT
jgi:hypothetical protein